MKIHRTVDHQDRELKSRPGLEKEPSAREQLQIPVGTDQTDMLTEYHPE